MDCSNTSRSNNGYSKLNWQEITAKYSPQRGEALVESGLNEIYLTDAPTMRQLRDAFGDAAVNVWLTEQITYMFELTELKLDSLKVNSLIRLIRANYQWLKLTEFMHYVFLFRSGEFGKIYGKADGQTVMLSLKEFCKIRDSNIAAIAANREQDQIDEYLALPMAAANELSMKIAKMLASPEYAKYGQWRKEPWAKEMARAYFVDHTLKIFPGDMSYEEREEWAISRAI